MIKLSQFWIAVVGSIAVLISSCSGDSDPVEPIPMEVVAPDTYAWNDANGANTVSFGGQTTRLKQAAEICSKMGSDDATFAELDEMFNLGEGFSDQSLNYSSSGKKVANKTGAYSANSNEIVGSTQS